MQLRIYYDGDCPFCNAYIHLVRVREQVSSLELVDLRADAAARTALQAQGFDLDQGMVVELDGQRLAGADAIHTMALLSTPSGLFNRLNRIVFGTPALSRWLYPLLRAGRNAALTLLGRGPIAADEPARASVLDLFAPALGLFAFVHALATAYQYQRGWAVSTSVMALLGLALLLRPGSRRVLLLLLGVMAVDAVAQMPVNSNHTLIKNAWLIGALAAGVWHAWRATSWSSWFADVAAVGRALLLVMYFFGVFHKINADFLNPEVSCARSLWLQMPWPLPLIDNPLWFTVAAWGTLVTETAIAIMLLVPKLRRVGVGLGIGFHLLLATSGYAGYAAFSTLSIFLHLLYLSPTEAHRITNSAQWSRYRHWQGKWVGALVLLLWATAMWWLSSSLMHTQHGLLWLIPTAWLAWAVVRQRGAGASSLPGGAACLWPAQRWLVVVPLALLLNGFMPYLGLKTAQTINMFANLRLEAGVSNHLVFRQPPGPFGYLNDVVRIESAEGSAYLQWAAHTERHLVYYGLLDRLERTPAARVTFWRNGVLYERVSATELASDIRNELHPRWFRAWFHFLAVDMRRPKPCDLD